MPGPVTTAMIVGAVARYMADKAAGKVIGDSAVALWNRFQLFMHGEPLLSTLPNAYDSPNTLKKLETRLEEKLTENPVAHEELEGLYKQLPEDIQQSVNMNIQMGKENFNIQGSPGAKIKKH
jgi:hypothetical protein